MRQAIIIGGGPAGLTAAYELLKTTDIHPIILEASNTFGGISRTEVYKKNRMDIGGHRFFTKNKEVEAIWNEIMPLQGTPAKDDIILATEKQFCKGGPNPETEDNVMLLRHRVSRIYYLKKFFDYPISIKFQTFANMGLSRTMKAGCSYLGSMIHKRKENSLEDFYINRFGKTLYSMFFEDYTEKLWGIHPSKISPDWGAQRVKGLSIGKVLLSALKKPFTTNQAKVETSLIEQFEYPKKGPGQYWEAMADKILELGGEIRKNTTVVGVKKDNNQITALEVEDASGRHEITGDYYISSMAIKDLVEAMLDVPEDIYEIATNLPYRDFITVGLLCDKLEIKNKTKLKTVQNIVPDCWIYVQEREVKLGRIQVFNNWSPYMVDDLEHTVWIGLEYFCSEGDHLWSMEDDEFIAFAKDELEKIGVVKKEHVLDATRIRVKKAYPAYFGTYAQFDRVKDYLNQYENLFCIGRNGQHRYNNMDHSMLTAIETVRAIKEHCIDKSAIWNVNTEQDYHESTKKEESA